MNYIQSNLKISGSVENISANVSVLALNQPLDAGILNLIYDTINKGIPDIKALINNYMSGVLASNGGDLVVTVSNLFSNVGINLTPSETNDKINFYINNGVHDFFDFFVKVITDHSDPTHQHMVNASDTKINALLQLGSSSSNESLPIGYFPSVLTNSTDPNPFDGGKVTTWNAHLFTAYRGQEAADYQFDGNVVITKFGGDGSNNFPALLESFFTSSSNLDFSQSHGSFSGLYDLKTNTLSPTTAFSCEVLDFAGGAHTLMLNNTNNTLHKTFIFKDFGADDTINIQVAKLNDQTGHLQLGSDRSAFEAPSSDHTLYRGLLLQNEVVDIQELLQPYDRIANPDAMHYKTGGYLALDLSQNNSQTYDGPANQVVFHPKYDLSLGSLYSNLGADGIPDVTILFVGTAAPNLSQIQGQIHLI